ncbi:hypothetical protein ACFWOJ_34610 [Streptomyces sp. NPDC058439]|uniref:hypothetical protein n=1 Tax=Streptomyces sp. NPDC058439 TaxID=3346500 RepID=UPI003650315E
MPQPMKQLDPGASAQEWFGNEPLHRIAAGTEPVWERANWIVDGHGEPDLDRGRV